MNSARDHGGVIFIDLRDREGLTQVRVPSRGESRSSPKASHTLRDEDVIQVTGKVAKRLEGTDNDEARAPAQIEIVAEQLQRR